MIHAARAALCLFSICCLAACATAPSNPPEDHRRPGEPEETARRVHDVRR